MAINKTFGLFQIAGNFQQIWGAFDCEDGSGDRLLQCALIPAYGWEAPTSYKDVDLESFENPDGHEFAMREGEDLSSAVSRLLGQETSGANHAIA